MSRALGREPDLKELVENQRGKRIKEICRKRIEDHESLECTFRPNINGCAVVKAGIFDGSSGHRWRDDSATYLLKSTINLREPERIARDIYLCQVEKEEKRRADLLVREIEELRECTFHPQVRQSLI